MEKRNIKIIMNYIKYFKKERNILFNELKDYYSFLLQFRIYNMTKYVNYTINYLNNILKDKHISKNFKELIINISLYF